MDKLSAMKAFVNIYEFSSEMEGRVCTDLVATILLASFSVYMVTSMLDTGTYMMFFV